MHPYINQDGSVSSQMDLVLANTVHGLGLHIRESQPDLLVVHGDRVEALAGAIVGALNNARVAHIEGGEVSGTVDELLRHAVTKLSHIHFVANEDAAQRLRQMGEDWKSIFIIGSPDTDIMLSANLPDLEEVKRHYEVPFDSYGIVLYHPVTTERAQVRSNARELVDALFASGLNFVVIHPNNDPGAETILEELERLRGLSRFRFIPSMRFEYFLVLMKHATVMVGNSSAGVREAPAYAVPTVNIGTRQNSRFHCSSIVDVPEDSEAIERALANLPKSLAPVHHFGRGNCARGVHAGAPQPGNLEPAHAKEVQRCFGDGSAVCEVRWLAADHVAGHARKIGSIQARRGTTLVANAAQPAPLHLCVC